MTVEGSSFPQAKKTSVIHIAKRMIVKRLRLLRNDLSGEVLRMFLGYNPKRKDGS